MNKTVLYVDDDPHILGALRRLFFDSDFEVITAMDAHHAHAILKEMPVSVAVTDNRIPGTHGFEERSRR